MPITRRKKRILYALGGTAALAGLGAAGWKYGPRLVRQAKQARYMADLESRVGKTAWGLGQHAERAQNAIGGRAMREMGLRARSPSATIENMMARSDRKFARFAYRPRGLPTSAPLRVFAAKRVQRRARRVAAAPFRRQVRRSRRAARRSLLTTPKGKTGLFSRMKSWFRRK